jgi:hypothetical protein
MFSAPLLDIGIIPQQSPAVKPDLRPHPGMATVFAGFFEK